MTWKQIVYMVLDELKITSDDSHFNEDHVIFLALKYRSMLLKQHYKNIRKTIPESNYQTVCLKLHQVNAIEGDKCSGIMLQSIDTIPNLLSIAKPIVFTADKFSYIINYVSPERLKFTGHNKWLKNMIYVSLGVDNHLYLTSNNPQFQYLESINIKGVFENAEDVKSDCDSSTNTCDILDAEFPLEEALVPLLIQAIVKELGGSIYLPEDTKNNSKDDLNGNGRVQKENS